MDKAHASTRVRQAQPGHLAVMQAAHLQLGGKGLRHCCLHAAADADEQAAEEACGDGCAKAVSKP